MALMPVSAGNGLPACHWSSVWDSLPACRELCSEAVAVLDAMGSVRTVRPCSLRAIRVRRDVLSAAASLEGIAARPPADELPAGGWVALAGDGYFAFTVRLQLTSRKVPDRM